MNKQGLRLIDILDPPSNPWLNELLMGKVKLPAGVRVLKVDADGKRQSFGNLSDSSRY